MGPDVAPLDVAPPPAEPACHPRLAHRRHRCPDRLRQCGRQSGPRLVVVHPVQPGHPRGGGRHRQTRRGHLDRHGIVARAPRSGIARRGDRRGRDCGRDRHRCRRRGHQGILLRRSRRRFIDRVGSVQRTRSDPDRHRFLRGDAVSRGALWYVRPKMGSTLGWAGLIRPVRPLAHSSHD